MKRAAELFVIDEWGSDSGFVESSCFSLPTSAYFFNNLPSV